MKRFTLIAAIAPIALMGACDWQFADFSEGGGQWGNNTDPFLRGETEGITQQSTLWAETNGTAVDQTGIMAGSAMRGTTCGVRVNSGVISNDVDPNRTEEERITDALPDLDGQGVLGLAVSPSEITVIEYDDWDNGVVASYDISALDARFTDDGIAAIDTVGGGCEITWVEPGGDVTAQSIAAGACAGGWDVASNGIAVVNTSAGLSRVTGSGSEVIADGQDLVSWDAGLDLFYTANHGDSLITAMTDDGRIEWTTTVDGGIVDIEASGARGIVFVSVENADLTGALVMLDGLTGDVVNQAQTMGAARELSVSGDGHMVAATVTGQVHYLRVD